MVDYSRWDSFKDDDDDEPAQPPRPAFNPQQAQQAPQPIQQTPEQRELGLQLQQMVQTRSRVIEMTPTQFQWEVKEFGEVRNLCMKLQQGALFTRVPQTPSHASLVFVLKFHPALGFSIEGQGVPLPAFAVRMGCLAPPTPSTPHVHPAWFLDLRLPSPPDPRAPIGFEARSAHGEPNPVEKMGEKDSIIIQIKFDSPPGAQKPDAQNGGANKPTPKPAGAQAEAAAAGAGLGGSVGTTSGVRSASVSSSGGNRSNMQALAAALMVTMACLAEKKEKEEQESKVESDSSKGCIDGMRKDLESWKAASDLRLNALEHHADTMASSYARTVERGRAAERAPADPLQALRQTFKNGLVQLDGLERQRKELFDQLQEHKRIVRQVKATQQAQAEKFEKQLSELEKKINEGK